MKFQNSSIHGFKVMLCIKKCDEQTDGGTNNPEAICPSNFFEVGGIKKNLIKSYRLRWLQMLTSGWKTGLIYHNGLLNPCPAE